MNAIRRILHETWQMEDAAQFILCALSAVGIIAAYIVFALAP